MANRLLILSAAEQEVAEAFRWYESRQEGLGREFMRAVDARLHAIQRAPQTHGFVRRPYRGVMLRRFPFLVVYTHADNVVVVYAVFHASRDPSILDERLPPR